MRGPSLLEQFGALEDPRQSWKVLHGTPPISKPCSGNQHNPLQAIPLRTGLMDSEAGEGSPGFPTVRLSLSWDG